MALLHSVITRDVAAPKSSFGPFTLDVATGAVLRDGADIHLRPQAVDVLRVLLGKAGLFVSYEELIRDGWSGNVVSMHTVATTVGAVRKALGEYGSWIAYRPKLGYRLQMPGTEDLVRKGWHLWQRRTREGVEGALVCFEEASRQKPNDPAPLDGVTISYMTLATFGMRAPEEIYQPFREALARLVAIMRMDGKVARRARPIAAYLGAKDGGSRGRASLGATGTANAYSCLLIFGNVICFAEAVRRGHRNAWSSQRRRPAVPYATGHRSDGPFRTA